MSFSGSYDHSVDPKGRVVVPAQFRDEFRNGGQLALRRDHVALYDPAGWERHLVRLRELRDTGLITRPNFNRFMSLSTPISPDTQGRFGLPQRYRDSAAITTGVVIVGVDDHLAIYAAVNDPVPEGDSFDDLMNVLDGLPL